MQLRIGVHPNNLHLTLAAKWPAGFEGVEPVYVHYAEGRETGRRLAAGEIDLGGTGSTPPIRDQAAGLDVRYLAASAPRPENGAIVVAPGSAIAGIRDLAGRRVGLIDGSFHTYLLARVLEAAGMTVADVRRVEIPPAQARRALVDGSIDAWIAMAPLLEQVVASGEVRLLAGCGDAIPNRSVFWTLARRKLLPSTVTAFVRGLARLGAAIAGDRARAAALLGGDDASRDALAAWERTVAARDWRIVDASNAVLEEQRREAEALHRHGVLDTIPAPIAL